MIIDHTHPEYLRLANGDFNNGAYHYSKEIVKNIIPLVNTDRNWMTMNIPNVGADHSIVFIHSNQDFGQYEWLSNYKDLILVCSQIKTCLAMAKYGRTIYLPLSVDVEEVKKYSHVEKDRQTAYVGRRGKIKNIEMPENIDYICNKTREELLTEMAHYLNVYAVGRCAIEAKILDCNILPYDPRYPKPKLWKILDNKEAAIILNNKLKENKE